MESNMSNTKVLAHKELKWCWYMNYFNIEVLTVAMLNSLRYFEAIFDK